MNLRASLPLAVGLSLLGALPACGRGELPSRANVRVNGMLLGVSSTGLQWDGFGSVATSQVGELANALASGTPYATTVAVVTRIAAAVDTATAAPDPSVTVSLYVDGELVDRRGPTDGDANNDSFFPTFNTLTFDDVPIDTASDVRLRLTVTDEDLTDYEGVCVAEIGFSSILDALDAGTATQVRVAEQCGNQLLFITLSVSAMR